MILEMKLGLSLACCLSSLQTETWRAFWLSLSSWHKSCRNVSHVQIVCQNALNGPVWQSYYLTKIMDSLPMICKDSLANFIMFSGDVLVDGCPEHSLLSTDVRLSLKHLYHKKFYFGSWHYLWRLPVAFGGFLQRFETKFDADSLLLIIGHISCKDSSPNH